MKISLSITAIIIALAALFGFQQQKEITTLTTEWETLQNSADQKGISSDPDTTFSSTRIRNDSARAARKQAVKDFASDLADFGQRMEAAQKSGQKEDAAMMKEAMDFLDTLSNLSPADLKILMNALSADSSMKKETKQQLIMMSVMMIASENPEAALTIIAETSDSLVLDDQNRHILPMALSQYATTDPQGAASWIIENQDMFGDDLGDMKKQVLTSAAHQSFDSAMSIIGTLGLDDDPGVFPILAIGVKDGSQNDFLKALQDNNLSTEDRNTALRSLVNSPFIKGNFEAASSWIDSPKVSETDREAIIKNLHYYNIKQAPEKWLGWIDQQEAKSEATADATRQIISGWTEDNFVATGEWLQQLDSGETKTTAVETYASTLAQQEPVAAADWAETLPPGENRTKLLKEIHTSLKDKNPDAAAAFSDKHQLSE